MCRQQTSGQDYITQYAEQYMGQVFFFCLKKTGGPQEAEDLASDISLCILSELKKGVVPVYFPAWVWQIAKNRYSRWAAQKHRHAERFSYGNIDDFNIADETTVEELYLKSEEISLLKRELAFVSGIYRRILLAYYMEEHTVREIAEREKLSEGAVKMRLLPKNILLQADNNPSTIEELSMELGIAAPYMEEECSLLCKATLLKKTGEKYVTNFIILDKECQRRMYQAQLEDSKERSRLTDSIAEALVPVLEKLSADQSGMAKEEIKWFLVIYILDYCITKCDGYSGSSRKARENGEFWDFIGYEKAGIPERKSMGHNGNGTQGVMFWSYKIGAWSMWDRAGEMKYQQTLLLGDLLKNRRNISTLTNSEKEVWEGISGRFAHPDEKGFVIPDILVFEGSSMQELETAVRNHPLFPGLMEKVQTLFDKTVRILESGCRNVSREEMRFCASMQTFDIRMMMVEDEVESGRLIVPEEPEKSTLAMYMELSPPVMA